MVYLILGAGRFGRLAFRRLSQQDDSAGFVVVDHDPQALEGIQAKNPGVITCVEAEAVAFLSENLRDKPIWDWVLPMMPGHVAFGWLRRRLPASFRCLTVPVPEPLEAMAPVALRGPEGELYLSRASHVCPDDCLEPEEGCPISGLYWERPLFEELRRVSLPGWRVLVMASRQLAPGVGGYSPGQLLEMVSQFGGSEEAFLIATACRCHGVVHGVRGGAF